MSTTQETHNFSIVDTTDQQHIKGTPLVDDTIHHIMCFLPQIFILGTCMLISKQWYEQARKIPMALHVCRKDLLKSLLDRKDAINLTELEVDHIECGKLISSSANMSSLMKLSVRDVDGQEQGDDLCVAVSQSPYLTRLTSLAMCEFTIGEVGCQALAKSSTLADLQELTLCECKLDGTNADLLVSSLPKLTSLDLSVNAIGHFVVNNNGKKGLEQISHLCNLRVLKLSNNIGISDYDCELISQGLPKLIVLELLGDMVGDYGVQVIANSSNMRNLQQLRLGVAITMEGCESLTQSEYMSNLTVLDLSGCFDLGDESCTLITQSTFSKNLNELALNGCFISDLGFKTIAQSPSMAQLTKLNLGHNEISLYDGEYLTSTIYLNNLNCLILEYNEIDSEEITHLI